VSANLLKQVIIVFLRVYTGFYRAIYYSCGIAVLHSELESESSVFVYEFDSQEMTNKKGF